LNKWRYRLTLAHLSLAQRRYEDVEKLIAGMIPMISSRNQTSRQIECKLLLAAALQGMQRLPEATETLESCFTLAEPEGYIRIFLNGGMPVRDLLAECLKSGTPAHRRFAKKIPDAFDPSSSDGGSRSPTAGLIEPLTEHELEVLQLIVLGKTNEEIAHQLIVARGTIKAHAASIYRKLEVANRTEAVTRARQLGILSKSPLPLQVTPINNPLIPHSADAGIY
jgi:LuxR family maltose regulon positive regulatory protein